MYRNLSLSKKLLLGFLTVIVLAGLMIGIALRAIGEISVLSKQLYEGPYVLTGESMGVRRDINRVGRQMANAVLKGDYETYRADLEKTWAMLEERVKVLRQAGGDAAQMQALSEALSSLHREADALTAMLIRGETETAVQAASDEDTAYFRAFLAAASASEALYDSADNTAKAFQVQSAHDIVFAQTALAVSFAAMLLCAVAVALATTKAIIKPLRQIEEAAKELAVGNLQAEISYRSRDELGTLAESMRTSMRILSSYVLDIDRAMAEMAAGNFDIQPGQPYIGDFARIEESITQFIATICKALRQIDVTAAQVAAGAEQISSGAQALSQGSTQQASAVEELTAAVSEISQQVGTNAESAAQAGGKAGLAKAEIGKSDVQMQALANAIAHISEQSAEIAHVTKTIDELAFQTKILSLNASVEAARAGAAGKGFGVVAAEVRLLADKSAGAAQDTAQLISGSVQAVEEGAQLAMRTTQSMQCVVSLAEEAVYAVNTISKACREQAAAISQVLTGIGQISDVVQNNAATAEESAAASEQLAAQAQALQELVKQFHLREE